MEKHVAQFEIQFGSILEAFRRTFVQHWTQPLPFVRAWGVFILNTMRAPGMFDFE